MNLLLAARRLRRQAKRQKELSEFFSYASMLNDAECWGNRANHSVGETAQADAQARWLGAEDKPDDTPDCKK